MVLRYKIPILVLAFVVSGPALSWSQHLPGTVLAKIDSIFNPWDNPSSPGCVIGIVRHDSLILAKGYGRANLEYDIPNTPETMYHVASISKQFTAYAIVLLARQGKLRLDDEVKTHLPWFPDFAEKITLRHLLHHTSGIRDQWQLLAISGTRLDDVITQEHILKMIEAQQELNARPGEMYNYCNSGYTLLAEIIRMVTGQSLREYTDSVIFKPLGMSSTHFHDNYKEIEKNRAYSYDRKDNEGFSNSILSYSTAGATSLFTNVNDLAKWVMNFFYQKVGDQKDLDVLTTNGKLNNGYELNYALGMVVDTFKGWKQFSHSGGDAGYRTYLTLLPELRMGFFIFSNLSDFNQIPKLYEVVDLFVGNKNTDFTAEKKSRDSASVLLKNAKAFQPFTGHYISEDGLLFYFGIRDRTLFVNANTRNNFLIPESGNTFSVWSSPDTKFSFNISGPDTLIEIRYPNRIRHLQKYIPGVSYPDDVLNQYTGTYYSPELDCSYAIHLKDHQLYLTHSKYRDSKLTLLGPDHLQTDKWWMNHMMMLRDGQNRLIGLEINSGRVMRLQFNKLN